MATITVRLPEEQKRLFMLIAEQQGVSASFILRRFINSFIEGTIAKLIAEIQELTEALSRLHVGADERQRIRADLRAKQTDSI